MAKWLKVNALMRSVDDEQRRETLGIENLDVEALVKPITIDLERVESYAPSLDREGNEIDDEVDIILYSGLSITLKYSHDDFDILIRKNG